MGRKRQVREKPSESYSSDYNYDFSRDYGHNYSQEYSRDYSKDYSIDTRVDDISYNPSQRSRVSFSLSKPTKTLASAITVLRPKAKAENVFDPGPVRDHGAVAIKPETAESAKIVIKSEVEEEHVFNPGSEEEGGGILLHHMKYERGGDYKDEEAGKYHKDEEEKYYKGEEEEYYKHQQEEEEVATHYRYKQEEEGDEKGEEEHEYQEHYEEGDFLKFEGNTQDTFWKTEDEKYGHAEHTPHEHEEALGGRHHHCSEPLYKHEQTLGEPSYKHEEILGEPSYKHEGIQGGSRRHASDPPYKREEKAAGSYQQSSVTLYKHPRHDRGSPTPRKVWRYKDPKNPDGSWKPKWEDRKMTKQEKADAKARLPSALGDILEKAGGGSRKKVTRTTEFQDLVDAMEDRLRKRARDPDSDKKKEDVDLGFPDFLEKHGRHRVMSEKLERQALLKANKRICLEKKELKKENERLNGNPWQKRR